MVIKTEVFQLFGVKLKGFCSEEELYITGEVLLPEDRTYTFQSISQNSTSCLDHIVSTHSAHHAVESVSVNYEYISSDHLPITMTNFH